MPIINGVKMACDVCLRGHRGAVCNHTDRHLQPVRRRGRPKGKKDSAPRSDGTQRAKFKAHKTADGHGGSQDRSSSSHAGTSAALSPASCNHREAPTHGRNMPLSSAALTAYPASTLCPSSFHGPSQSHTGTYVSHLPDVGGPSPHYPAPMPSAFAKDGHALAQQTTPAALDMSLLCTCPEPCPCPYCPAHPKQSSVGDPVPGRKCCDTEASSRSHEGHRQIANVAVSGLCGGCLPCILAPYEDGAASTRGMSDTAALGSGQMANGPGRQQTSPVRAADVHAASTCSPAGSSSFAESATYTSSSPPPLTLESSLDNTPSGPLFPDPGQLAAFSAQHLRNPEVRQWYRLHRTSDFRPSSESASNLDPFDPSHWLPRHLSTPQGHSDHSN